MRAPRRPHGFIRNPRLRGMDLTGDYETRRVGPDLTEERVYCRAWESDGDSFARGPWLPLYVPTTPN